MADKTRINGMVDSKVAERVAKMASKERRPVSTMIEILLEEALNAREAKKGFVDQTLPADDGGVPWSQELLGHNNRP